MAPDEYAEDGSRHTTKGTEEPSNPLSHQHVDEVDENASEPEPSDIYVKTPRKLSLITNFFIKANKILGLRPWRNKRKRKANEGRENQAYWDNLRRKRTKRQNNESTLPPHNTPAARVSLEKQRNRNYFTTQAPFQTLARTSQDLGGKMHDNNVSAAQPQEQEG